MSRQPPPTGTPVPELERLGKYDIRGVLGKGAMGIVYKGFDPQIERPVAIKTIRKDTVDPDLAAQFLWRFRNEAKAAGRLSHPNIVAVYEYGEDESVAYIAMEYVEGTGLREYLNRRTAFDFAQLVDLMTQLLDALEFAHRNGVVHRDIKPSNLIVTDRGRLKVADFGVARIEMQSNLTTAGMVIGTPSYMSPEQCQGGAIDARSDIFSAGVVLYELLTGVKPFRGAVEAIAYKICREEPTPPSELSGMKLPAAVDQMVATALAKDRNARFASARAFNEALRAVAQMSVEVDSGQGTTLVSIGTVMLQKPAPVWDEASLATAEHELARFLGPMAKLVVRRAAAQTNDRAELCSMLSANIDDSVARRQFVEAFSRSVEGSHPHATGSGTAKGAPGTHAAHAGPGARTSATAATVIAGASVPAAPVDAAFVDQATARLAVHLGPIARIVAKRAAQQASTRSEFVRRLADHLGTQDRVAFLREIGFPDL
jgi:serine/threonine-protein kinase